MEKQAIQYFDIRIWGAPLTLLNYVILGWLIGMSKVRLSLFVQLFMNITNIILDLIFVKVFLMGTVGVATASLIAEFSGFLIGLIILGMNKQLKGIRWNWSLFFHKASITKMLYMNGDLFMRTLFLLSVFGLFTAKGTAMGEQFLAANAILMQIQFIISYILGGFANASSILVGRAIGERNIILYNHTIKLTAIWSSTVSLLLAVVLFVAGDEIITWFTTNLEIQETSTEYLPWLIIFPLVGFWGLQLNGIFTGATAAKQIRNSMILSFLIFILTLWLFVPLWKNHGLWFAFILFTLARSLFLGRSLPALRRTVY
ncbi:MATE family efflux transporter [Bacillus sp. T3]|uniref:MATE family efflux transporter n=1 Tax=Bacillus sp. T3 TaxID=467262 RepID=UPI0029820B98|nr:MATE family efflux transporter [Bacillus sp. T3]